MGRTILLLCVGTLSGCSEYDITSMKEDAGESEIEVDTGGSSTLPPTDPPDTTGSDSGIDEDVPDDLFGPPQLEVTPGSVLFEGICTRQEQTLLARNVGESPLQIIDVAVEGEGWTAVHDPVPLTLNPSQAFPITVAGNVGMGRVILMSDDPVVPEIRIPLEATPDSAPSLVIASPLGGEVLAPGAVTTFEARVSDETDSPETLLVEWLSLGGEVLGSGYADATGMATFEWSASVLGTGDQAVMARVSDSCGNTTESTVAFCQNEGYTEDSIDLESWNFEGSSLWDAENEWVELTAAVRTQAGTAFQTSSTVSSDSVNIEFDFYVSGGTGADGISLTALDVHRMTTFVGGTGGGIGYVGLPGWSIEVDTWYNREHNDPTPQDHLSVHIDGNVNDPRVWATLPEMEDGAWHRAMIDVAGSHMRVWIDEVLYIDETIDGLEPFEAYVGFTAATGGSTNWHLIDALEVEGFVCDE